MFGIDDFFSMSGANWLSGEGKNYAWFKRTFLR